MRLMHGVEKQELMHHFLGSAGRSAHPAPETWCPATKEQGLVGSGAPRPARRSAHLRPVRLSCNSKAGKLKKRGCLRQSPIFICICNPAAVPDSFAVCNPAAVPDSFAVCNPAVVQDSFLVRNLILPGCRLPLRSRRHPEGLPACTRSSSGCRIRK